MSETPSISSILHSFKHLLSDPGHLDPRPAFLQIANGFCECRDRMTLESEAFFPSQCSPCAAAVAKFRLLTGHDCLCAHLFRFNLVTSPICVLCDTGQDMTAAHLDECSALNDLNCIRCIFQRTIDKYSACVEVGKPIDENSACVEVGTTHKHLRRGVNLNNFKNYFSSNDITCEEVKSVEPTFLLDTSYVRATREPEKKKGRIFLNFSKMYKNALKEDLIRVVEELDGIVESTDTIVKLKTKIENSSTFESDPDFVKTLIQNCIDERVSQNEREVTSEQKIELAKLQLAKLEKEVELQLAKNKALSLNPAAKVEEKQFETNIENMIKKINDEYKSEILINLLGERAHNVLLYIKEEELNDYEKLKSIVLREFQLTPRECLNSFKNAVKSSGETYIQFAARLTANFQYYCSLRKVNSFESLCDLIISDKLFETLNKETATHIGIREAEDWFRPIDLAKECDIYISSRSGSHKEIPITYGYTQDPFKNRSQNFKPKVKENYPQYHERENKKLLYMR
ncbi:integrase catalytic domain-containing protein [Trichonephila clavipes]|nr:integrase catalytic domain-containing protein [Trichonephila clavipes]